MNVQLHSRDGDEMGLSSWDKLLVSHTSTSRNSQLHRMLEFLSNGTPEAPSQREYSESTGCYSSRCSICIKLETSIWVCDPKRKNMWVWEPMGKTRMVFLPSLQMIHWDLGGFWPWKSGLCGFISPSLQIRYSLAWRLARVLLSFMP